VDNELLIKLRPSVALRAAELRVNLRPLYENAEAQGGEFGLTGQAQWFVAELEQGATPWDAAHGRIADQLGVAESDIEFAEPDLVHTIYGEEDAAATHKRMAAAGTDCKKIEQETNNGRTPAGPANAWHLRDDFSQLGSARDAVTFTDPRTRIGHFDTGYSPTHKTKPRGLPHSLERNFARKGSAGAADPDGRGLPGLDNTGHGTGTIGILAGREDPEFGILLGGAPDADVVPLRIADSVVLLHTSAFARALQYATENKFDVISMSMGGLPSEAWRDAIDRAYLAGICIVTAAGNNFRRLPTGHVVYPARYGRVICACGAMANKSPYAGLKGLMEGNYGPDSVMKHALAAYSPNIPWAVFDCDDLVRRNGAGTSSATPQIAAAAALWFEKYKSLLPRDWRRVEAVRHALFSTAANKNTHHKEFGNGIVQAFAALQVKPDLTRPQTKSDSHSFPFLRVITGLGLTEETSRERMFNLEVAQLWLLSEELHKLVDDPAEANVGSGKLNDVMEAIIADDRASDALRKHIAARYTAVTRKRPSVTPPRIVAPDLPVCDMQPTLGDPPYRRLRVYAVDPSFSTQLATAGINEVTLQVRWEQLTAGPVGEYLAVEDVKVGGKSNAVNLNEPRLLAQDGWAPSEGNPQFHQQMVYAVAMKTIEHFEKALGRPVLWRHGRNPKKATDDSIFTQRLVIKPHALRQANAFYSPQDLDLKFGYFEVPSNAEVDLVPGSRVYACLSHDIIAHETTHAILDGMHRRFNEPTNPDVLAFHEAFSDIVALFQHFTMRDVLINEVRLTRGDIEAESMLGSLAIQFGKAMGGRGALREAIGRVENGVWKRSEPNPKDLHSRLAPHARGAILVAAVFDAFLAIYKTRVADLVRIYTGGTGVLPNGAIHPDLVARLADEASKSASHVLTMCIRALDYLPPVDITFFEYLRALITADFDLVPDDKHNYRVAFVEAFRRRGIYPVQMEDRTDDVVRTMAVDTLRWQGLDHSKFWGKPELQETYLAIVDRLRDFAARSIYLSKRDELFKETHAERRKLQIELRRVLEAAPELMEALGLDSERTFEVHELRPSMRTRPDGRYAPQVVLVLTQSQNVSEDADQGVPEHTFRGGSTLLVDLSVPEIKYCIRKRVISDTRRARTENHLRMVAADPLRALFLAPEREPFALLHELADQS
jgi:hypothetical protein